MDNIKWRCIFQSRDTMFFAQNTPTKVFISDGMKCVCEYSKENVSGCTYNGKILWMSIENRNILIVGENGADHGIEDSGGI